MTESSYSQRLRQIESRNEVRTTRLLRLPLIVIDAQLDMLYECADLAQRTHKAGKDQDFMFAYIGLGSKIASNASSMLPLLKTGHYGDALALLRVMMSAANTIQFLYFYDEHIKDWIGYSELRTPARQSDPERQRIYRVFEDKSVRKKLRAKNIDPTDDVFQDLSEGIHSSLWGLQYYGRVSYTEPGAHSFQFEPSYDPIRAAGLAIALLGVLVIPPDTFLDRYREALGVTDEWEKLAVRWTLLRTESLMLGDKLRAKVREALKD